MQLDELKIAYDMINKFSKYDTLSNPPRINTLDYRVPVVSGLHSGEYGKNIEEVKQNTLNYILYHLHDIDYTLVTDTLIALLYYWKFRKKKSLKMEQAYQEIVSHYTVEHEPYTRYENSKKGNCIYLVKIYIGSKILYKVGITEDIHQRIVNLQSDINIKYPCISVGIDVQKVIYCENNKEMEKILLNDAKSHNIKKHKFFFDGYTEAFESDILINIFKQHTAQ